MDKPFTLHNSDALEVMKSLPDNSVSLIATDPPYYKVKDEPWDNQWETPEGFLSWMDELAQEWQRILKPNGSLYVFASPQMAWNVEGVVRNYFNVLTHIVWRKEGGRINKADKELFRSYWQNSERIIFAEQFGSDNAAKGEAGYEAKSDDLRGFVFEPLRSYLDGERVKSGKTRTQVNKYLGNQMSGHYFSSVQWVLPTQENYEKMQVLFAPHLRQEYEALRQEYEALRQEYEALRQEYEALRRPFNSSADVPVIDVWDYPSVQAYAGKHPCEKPAAMMEQIVSMSSNPDDIVLDCFMGSGSTGAACGRLHRKFIGIEKGDLYFRKAHRRIATAYRQFDQVHILKPSVQSLEGLPLFNGGG